MVSLSFMCGETVLIRTNKEGGEQSSPPRFIESNSAEPDLSVIAGRVPVIGVCAAGLQSPHGACYAPTMLRIGATLGSSVGPSLGQGIVRAGMESVGSGRVSGRNGESHHGCRSCGDGSDFAQQTDFAFGGGVHGSSFLLGLSNLSGWCSHNMH